MTARAFRSADLERAIAAAKRAGLVVKRAEVWPDGRIVLSETQQDAKDDALGDWLARNGNRDEGAA